MSQLCQGHGCLQILVTDDIEQPTVLSWLREFLLSLQMLKRCPYPADSSGLAQEVGQSTYALACCPQLSHLSEFDLVSL